MTSQTKLSKLQYASSHAANDVTVKHAIVRKGAWSCM